jgi:hypothetical protein
MVFIRWFFLKCKDGDFVQLICTVITNFKGYQSEAITLTHNMWLTFISVVTRSISFKKNKTAVLLCFNSCVWVVLNRLERGNKLWYDVDNWLLLDFIEVSNCKFVLSVCIHSCIGLKEEPLLLQQQLAYGWF